MIDRIYNQMQAMQVLSRSQDVTADNLANINTPGFKGNKVFHRLFREKVNGEVVTRNVPMQQIDLSQGVLEATGNEFDLGINGEGFFKVEADGNTFLTRDGRFHLNQDGYLVNSSGANVLGDSGPIQLTEYFQAKGNKGGMPQMNIAKDGTIRMNGKVVEHLQIVKVNDSSDLERKGSAYFTLKAGAEVSEENTGAVMQGYYEKGNVEPLAQMVDMMRTSQTFESQQRAMKTTDEMLSMITTRLGKF